MCAHIWNKIHCLAVNCVATLRNKKLRSENQHFLIILLLFVIFIVSYFGLWLL